MSGIWYGKCPKRHTPRLPHLPQHAALATMKFMRGMGLFIVLLLVGVSPLFDAARAHASPGFVSSATSIDLSPLSSAETTTLANCWNNGACTTMPTGTLRRMPNCNGQVCGGCYGFTNGSLRRLSDLNSAGTCDTANGQALEVIAVYRTEQGPTPVAGGRVLLGCRMRTVGTAAGGSSISNIDAECFGGRPFIIDSTSNSNSGGNSNACTGLGVSVRDIVPPSAAGGADGAVTAFAAGITAPTYQFLNSASQVPMFPAPTAGTQESDGSQTFSGFPRGLFSVRATDSSGCQVVTNVRMCDLKATIEDLKHPTEWVSNIDGTRSTKNDGSVTIRVAGGDANSVKTWSLINTATGASVSVTNVSSGGAASGGILMGWGTGASGTANYPVLRQFAAMPAGVYTFTVTDPADQCTATQNVTLGPTTGNNALNPLIAACPAGTRAGSGNVTSNGCGLCPLGTYKASDTAYDVSSSVMSSVACQSCSLPNVVGGTYTTVNAAGVPAPGATSQSDCVVTGYTCSGGLSPNPNYSSNPTKVPPCL